MSDDIKLPAPAAYQIAEIYEWEDGQAISGWNIADANSYRATMHPKRALYTADQLRAAVSEERSALQAKITSLQARCIELAEAVRTSVGNVRSLGPAGALGPFESYRAWLEQLEGSLSRAQAVRVHGVGEQGHA